MPDLLKNIYTREVVRKLGQAISIIDKAILNYGNWLNSCCGYFLTYIVV